MLYVDLFAQDGVDNSGVKADALYTTPQQVNLCLYKNVTDLSQSFNDLNPSLQVFKVHQALSPISPMFSIAAAFGNVHGVYKVNQING